MMLARDGLQTEGHVVSIQHESSACEGVYVGLINAPIGELEPPRQQRIWVFDVQS